MDFNFFENNEMKEITQEQADQNEEFIREFVEWAAKNSEPFEGIKVIDAKQLKKYALVVKYLIKLKDEIGGRVEDYEINPMDQCGWFTIEIPLLDLVREDLKEFIHVMSNVDVLGITPTNRGTVYVGINVNNVFKEIKKS